MPPKLVSVVIPAYNSQETILETLHGIAAQDYEGDIEIIVVDDGSSDQTSSVVKSFQKAQYIYQKNSGPAAARNRGFHASCGEIIFFTDSDCVPQPNWISKMLPHFADTAIGVVSGSYGITNKENRLARCIYKEIIFRHHTLMPEFPKSFGSYNFSIRRNIFLEVQGFNESYPHASGEDNDLSYKIFLAGYKIYFEKGALVNHRHPDNLGRYWREQFRHGFWRVKMYQAYLQMAKGDDYTFWKDIIEPVLVVMFLGGIIGGFLGNHFLLTASLIVAILSVIEIFYAGLITKNAFESFYYGFVMFARAFARTFGFLVGVFRIFLPKSLQKK